jgi:hypothetical protein
MGNVLENLAVRIESELGLVAHCVRADSTEKIVGASEYDDRDGIALYIKKFEVFFSGGQYRLRLPIGQTFIEKTCTDATDALDSLADHFSEYHPSVKLKRVGKDKSD